MEDLGGLILGSLFLGFALVVAAASLFKIRHWQDWPDRWAEANPAVSWVLLSETFGRTIPRDRMPRSRREAILWEAPALFISAALVAVAFVLIAVGPG
jgi:hypothetical protein